MIGSDQPRHAPTSWQQFRTTIKHRWTTPFYYVDWVCSHIAYRIRSWSILEVLEYAGTFSVLVAVIVWMAETGERTQQRHYQAWQVINTAQGKGGSGGRHDALQQLNDDHVPLVGVDVAEAYLQNVNLEKAELRRATFRAADLRNAHFRRAKLQDVNFVSANLRAADLRESDLTDANFTDADLAGADLRGARLAKTSFAKADLRGADLSGIKRWKSIESIKLANIDAVKNPPEGFIRWALDHGAVQIADTGAWNAALAKSGAQ